MKKVFLAIGIFSFILFGAIGIESTQAQSSDQVVVDDPPKADKKTSKSCADYSKSSKCCSSKTATSSASKGECTDKDSKTASSTKTSTAATTKKDNPDKK